MRVQGLEGWGGVMTPDSSRTRGPCNEPGKLHGGGGGSGAVQEGVGESGVCLEKS